MTLILCMYGSVCAVDQRPAFNKSGYAGSVWSAANAWFNLSALQTPFSTDRALWVSSGDDAKDFVYVAHKMEDYGITGLQYNGDLNAVANAFQAAGNGRKVALFHDGLLNQSLDWTAYNAATTDPQRLAIFTSAWITQLQQMQSLLLNHPNVARADGHPVIILYGGTRVPGLSPDSTPALWGQAVQTIEAATYRCIWLYCQSGFTWDATTLRNLLPYVDGVSQYGPWLEAYRSQGSIASIMKTEYPQKIFEAEATYGSGCEAYGGVVGADEQRMTATLRDSWDYAVGLAPDSITAVNWSDLVENSAIEPTYEKWDSSLRISSDKIKKFRSQSRGSATPDLIETHKTDTLVGEPLEFEIVGMPMSASNKNVTIDLRLEDEQGAEVYAFSPQSIVCSDMKTALFRVSSLGFAQKLALFPKLSYTWNGTTYGPYRFRGTKLRYGEVPYELVWSTPVSSLRPQFDVGWHAHIGDGTYSAGSVVVTTPDQTTPPDPGPPITATATIGVTKDGTYRLSDHAWYDYYQSATKFVYSNDYCYFYADVLPAITLAGYTTTVNSATLDLYTYGTAGPLPGTLKTFAGNTSWTEASGPFPGWDVEYASTPIAANGYQHINVKDMVQGWVNGKANNGTGLYFGAVNSAVIVSRHETGSGWAGTQPKFTINYTQTPIAPPETTIQVDRTASSYETGHITHVSSLLNGKDAGSFGTSLTMTVPLTNAPPLSFLDLESTEYVNETVTNNGQPYTTQQVAGRFNSRPIWLVSDESLLSTVTVPVPVQRFDKAVYDSLYGTYSWWGLIVPIDSISDVTVPKYRIPYFDYVFDQDRGEQCRDSSGYDHHGYLGGSAGWWDIGPFCYNYENAYNAWKTRSQLGAQPASIAPVYNTNPDGTKYLYFDGVNDRVTLPPRTMFPYGETWELIIRPENTGKAAMLVEPAGGNGCRKMTISLDANRYLVVNAITQWQWDYPNLSLPLVYSTITSSAPIPTNQWTHIAVVNDCRSIKLYVNRIQSGQTLTLTKPASFFKAGSMVKLGGHFAGSDHQWLADAGTDFYKGGLQEVRITGRPLAPNELIKCSPYISIADAKRSQPGSIVGLTGSITAVLNGTIYIETSNRASGIRVDKADHGFSANDVGKVVNVIGSTAKDSVSNEVYIAADLIGTTSETNVIEPLVLSNKNIGGGGFTNPVTGNGQVGVVGGLGLNNIGLLVRSTGHASAGDANGFTMTDGSGVTLNISLAGAGSAYNGQYVVVTGISSIGSGGVRLIKARSAGDVRRVL